MYRIPAQKQGFYKNINDRTIIEEQRTTRTCRMSCPSFQPRKNAMSLVAPQLLSESTTASIEQHLQKLETRLSDLLDACEHYQRQNRALKAREAQLLEERTQLLKKNDLARVKVEAMITRLKAMEQDT
ncbi:Hypothetical protein HDN1F_01220 [gamma proteobacterium HdN1]|nr:Hypothetical protein HDN1F_01220 [gamma proteobacterium HdN1]